MTSDGTTAKSNPPPEEAAALRAKALPRRLPLAGEVPPFVPARMVNEAGKQACKPQCAGIVVTR